MRALPLAQPLMWALRLMRRFFALRVCTLQQQLLLIEQETMRKMTTAKGQQQSQTQRPRPAIVEQWQRRL